MDNIKFAVKHKLFRVWQYIYSFIKWVIIAGVTGVLGGLIGGAFRVCINYVTGIREANSWFIYLLPIAGLVIALLYRASKLSGIGNTNMIINSVRSDTKVPLVLAPVIFISTLLTHLCGGSAGREGAALQLGGSIGMGVGKLFRLDEKDMHIVVMCGMSGFFCALFGTVLTATLFAMEVISVGIMYYSSFVPCMVSSLCAYGVTSTLFGLKSDAFVLKVSEQLSAVSVLKVALLAVGCAVVSILFCLALKWTHRFAEKYFKNEYLRLFTGGVVVVLLTLLVGSQRYSGTGTDIILSAVQNGDSRWYDFLLKMLFTVIAISFGFKGGEIIPTFFIGASFGCVFGNLLGLSPGFCAAVGIAALFCAVVNCPIASLALCVELFPNGSIVLFALAVCISYMLSGYYGLYTGQKIMYSKRRARYVNRNAK